MHRRLYGKARKPNSKHSGVRMGKPGHAVLGLLGVLLFTLALFTDRWPQVAHAQEPWLLDGEFSLGMP